MQDAPPAETVEPRPTRRAVVASAAGALLALPAVLPLAGCDELDGDRVTLRFWNGFTGPDGRTILALIQRFNAANADVQVVMQRMEWGTYYNKLFVAGLGGRAPDIFVVHNYTLARLSSANFVRPVDDLVGPGWLDVADFDENVWAAVERDGKHWGVPLDIHMLGMFYNRTLFTQAGLVDDRGNPKPPTTRAEFLHALSRIRNIDLNGDGLPDRPDVWGFVFTWMRTNLYSVFAQHGGGMFSDDLSRVTVNSPQNVNALQFCVDLIRREKLVPPPENFDSWIGFRQGKVGIVFEGIYMLPELQRQKDLDYAAAPLPVLGDRPAAWGSSHTLCLRADLDERRLDAAKRFMKYLSDNSLDWAEGGQIPVRKSLRASPRFQKMDAQREFAKQIPYAAYLPSVPFIFECLTEFDLAIEQALRGSRTPQQALDRCAAEMTRIMERYRRSGRWTPPAQVASAADVAGVER